MSFMLLTKRQKEIKKTCTFRMYPEHLHMLAEISSATDISRSEILAQLVESYYNTNSLKLKNKKEVSSKVYVAE